MKKLLSKIDSLYKKNFRDISASLFDGASDGQIKKLVHLFYSGTIPPDFIDLFKWHNGQSLGIPLDPRQNRSLLSVDEILKAHNFLTEVNEGAKKSYSESWIPIMYNGSGDYLMYESGDICRGKLVSYWHDDPEREYEYNSVKDLLLELKKSLSMKETKEEFLEEHAYEKVDVYLLQESSSDLKLLMEAKKELNLDIGVAFMKSNLSKGDLLIISDTYLSNVDDTIANLTEKCGKSFFRVRSCENKSLVFDL